MIIGNKNFDTKNNCYIMGILNVTPDSFSDGGKYNSLDKALFRVEKMLKDGADIIDIGGESTRPNHTKISVAEEINRVSPIIEKIKENFAVPISLDSYKAAVIEANINQIDLINDIWGLKYDPKMAQLIAKSKLPCCLMHNRKDNNYSDFFVDFIEDLKETLALAKAAGIKKEQIILDAGVGFQKTYNQNLEVINKTEKIVELAHPVMIATSRKSVIGLTLNKPVDKRIYGTIATTVVGIIKGASFIRVHEINENYDAIKMTKSILKESLWTK
jgi:dihydropteroate synthase